MAVVINNDDDDDNEDSGSSSGSRGFRTVDEIVADQEAGTIDTGGSSSSSADPGYAVASVEDPETGQTVKVTDEAYTGEAGDPVDTGELTGGSRQDVDVSGPGGSGASGSSSTSNNESNVPTVEGDNGIDQAVPSVEDPETGRNVRIDNPAVGGGIGRGDRVDTERLTGGSRSEVIVSGPGGSGVEAAGFAPGLARQKIERERQSRESRQTRRSVQPNRNNLPSGLSPNQELFRRSKRETQNIIESVKGDPVEPYRTDYGTRDSNRLTEGQLRRRADLTTGETAIIEAAGGQAALGQEAQESAEYFLGEGTAADFTGALAEEAVESPIILEQIAAIGEASLQEPGNANLGQRLPEGAEKVGTALVENPVTEAAPELIGLGFGVGTARISINTGGGKSFVDESSTVLDTESLPEGTRGQPGVKQQQEVRESFEDPFRDQTRGRRPSFEDLSNQRRPVSGTQAPSRSSRSSTPRKKALKEIGVNEQDFSGAFGGAENVQDFAGQNLDFSRTQRLKGFFTRSQAVVGTERVGVTDFTEAAAEDFDPIRQENFLPELPVDQVRSPRKRTDVATEKLTEFKDTALGKVTKKRKGSAQLQQLNKPEPKTETDEFIDSDLGRDRGSLPGRRTNTDNRLSNGANTRFRGSQKTGSSTGLGLGESLGLSVGLGVDTDIGQAQGQGQGGALDQGTEEEQISIQTQSFGNNAFVGNGLKLDRPQQPFIDESQSFTSQTSSSAAARADAEDGDSDEEDFLFGEPVEQSVDPDTEFRASVAGLFGAEGVSETDRALTGLEIREPTGDEDPLKDL